MAFRMGLPRFRMIFMTSIACRVAIREGVSVGTPRTDSGLLDFPGFLAKQVTHEKLFPYTSRPPFFSRRARSRFSLAIPKKTR